MALSLEFNENLTPILSPSAVSWTSHYEVLHFKENEIIFREGEDLKGLYYLKSGCVKTVANRALTRGRMASPEYITKVVGNGEFFGYQDLAKGIKTKVSAKAIRATEIHLFSKEALNSIMNGPNSLLKMVFNQAIKDLESYENVSQLHYLASVQERIAYQLVLLSDRFGTQMLDGIHLQLRLTRNELAQLAGTINESLSRHLTEFKAEGIIDLNGKEIIIKNREALMKKSGNFQF